MTDRAAYVGYLEVRPAADSRGNAGARRADALMTRPRPFAACARSGSLRRRFQRACSFKASRPAWRRCGAARIPPRLQRADRRGRCALAAQLSAACARQEERTVAMARLMKCQQSMFEARPLRNGRGGCARTAYGATHPSHPFALRRSMRGSSGAPTRHSRCGCTRWSKRSAAARLLRRPWQPLQGRWLLRRLLLRRLRRMRPCPRASATGRRSSTRRLRLWKSVSRRGSLRPVLLQRLLQRLPQHAP